MGLETGTYISDLVATNPLSSDAKSVGDDHIRLLKATVKATFPNISGAVTPTHTQLNTVPDLAPKASPTFTGTPLAPTATAGTSTTQIATTAFVAATAFTSVLPGQTGNSGKYVTTDGTNASWSAVQIIPTVVVATASGTWTCPSGITRAKFTVTGGGGSAPTNASISPVGGAAGGTAIAWRTVVPGIVYTITIGAGGTATSGASANGVVGGDTTVTGSGFSTITGIGGVAAATGASYSVGGAATGGDINLSGGGSATVTNGGSTIANIGGSSYWGGGLSAATSPNFGCGGGAQGLGATAGAAGSPGIVVIEY